MPLMNPLGVRWGRSDSERLSPPPSFSSVHFFTSFHLFTSGCAHQWCTHSGAPTLKHPLWCTHQWCTHSGESLYPLESHCLHWRVIISTGESLPPLESHRLHWRVIVPTGESLTPTNLHQLSPFFHHLFFTSCIQRDIPTFCSSSPTKGLQNHGLNQKSIMDSMEIMKPRSNKSTGKSMCWKY